MTGAADRATALAAIATVPRLNRLDAATLDIVRLGGLTNLVFRVQDGAEAYCLRVPGKGTAAYINRGVEAVNARAAAAARVSPEVLHFGNDGIMVTRFLAGCVTMTPETLRTTPGAPARAARAFRRLHRCGRVFAFRFELFAMIDGYLAHLETSLERACRRAITRPSPGRSRTRGAGGTSAAARALPLRSLVRKPAR